MHFDIIQAVLISLLSLSYKSLFNLYIVFCVVVFLTPWSIAIQFCCIYLHFNNLYPTDVEDFYPIYTEVEPFRDTTPRPVLIFGVAAEALIERLLEEYPETFVSPKKGK